MPDRAFLTRLRTSDGPSHTLLVLLDQHRVMTTAQLARATGTPDRTARYRLDQLREANLVECVRPGRESGSAPQHWWLRPAGARLVTGTAAAEGRPSAMFVAHAAAITEVWLALVEHGPSVGIEPGSWLADRAGWQEWDGDRHWTRRNRLTPDAVATVTVAGSGIACVFVEVDLASMTQTVLKQKVARYLAYAAARAWKGAFPHCPPMLLLTTTPTRAATFVRAASRPLAEQRAAVEDPGAALIVAACGHVRQPARAVAEPCWTLPETTTELTLAEILTDRLAAQNASQAWHNHYTAVIERRQDIDELRRLQAPDGLAHTVGNERAAAVLRVLIGADPAGFLDAVPDLAGGIVDWARQRRRVGRFEARDLAQPWVRVLEERFDSLWAQQARHLLAAQARLAAGDPAVYRIAAALADGNLAEDLAILDAPPGRTRQALQDDVLGDYPARRTAAIEATWQALSRRIRRHTSRQDLADRFDAEHLLICATCTMVYPLPETLCDRCPHCDGTLLDWVERARVTSLVQRLDVIRSRLAEAG
jgi:hypothetical protein